MSLQGHSLTSLKSYGNLGRSLSTREVPDIWKKANIALMFKEDQKASLRRYRPVSLTVIHKKTMDSPGECFWTHEGEGN